MDFDLAAFHSKVRILKRTLRELTEASLCNILLQDFSKATPEARRQSHDRVHDKVLTVFQLVFRT